MGQGQGCQIGQEGASMKKTGVLGFGNMGEALIKGILKKHPDAEITVYDRDEEKTEQCSYNYTVKTAESVKELFNDNETIILAVKPQEIEVLLAEIAPFSKGNNIISIIAGRATPIFADALKTENICRFMPNIAAQCGKALTAVTFYENCDEDFIPEAVDIAESIGTAVILPEKLFPASTALSASGIAFVFQFIHAMTMGGVRSGISYKQSLKIALAPIEGAVESVRTSGKQPVELAITVASPAGTTIDGLRTLEDKGFTGAVMDAVFASYRKAIELEELA